MSRAPTHKLRLAVAPVVSCLVFVPREHLGDASEAGKVMMPIITSAIAPFYPVFLINAITTTK